MSKLRGLLGEERARKYLEQRGLSLLEKNFQRATGEIDLIMEHQQAIVFIEVKCRQPNTFEYAFESISQQKQRRIINTAYCYLRTKNLLDRCDCRFDVIAVENKTLRPRIEWIQDAFTESEI